MTKISNMNFIIGAARLRNTERNRAVRRPNTASRHVMAGLYAFMRV